jgi:hypothetical protein
VRQQGEAQTDGDTVDGGEERYREPGERIEQSHESLTRSLGGGASRDGRHFCQILARGEGSAAAGEYDGADVGVLIGTAQRLGRCDVHRHVERVANLRAIEGQDPDALDAVLDLENGHGRALCAACRFGRPTPLPATPISLRPTDSPEPIR